MAAPIYTTQSEAQVVQRIAVGKDGIHAMLITIDPNGDERINARAFMSHGDYNECLNGMAQGHVCAYDYAEPAKSFPVEANAAVTGDLTNDHSQPPTAPHGSAEPDQEEKVTYPESKTKE